MSYLAVANSHAYCNFCIIMLSWQCY